MRHFLFAAGFAAAAVFATGAQAADTRQIQDWKVTCAETGCAAHHDSQGAQLVMGMIADGGGKRMVVRLSPNAAPGEPVAIRLDSGWQAGLAVADCNEQRCEAPVAARFQKPLEDAFATARSGVIAYKAGERMVIAPISLMGFTAASREVR